VRIFLLVAGAVLLLAGLYLALDALTARGNHTDVMLGGLVLIVMAIMALVQFGLLGDVSRLRDEVDALREAAKPASPPREAEAPEPAAPVDRSSEEAAALMQTAQDHHFAKRFAEAIALYRDVVTKYLRRAAPISAALSWSQS